MIAVTPGSAYTDIDGLACAVAYAELLRKEGKAAQGALPGGFNNTISASIRGWKPDFITRLPPDSQIVLVDVSSADFIVSFCRPEQVVEIYDHHTGSEEYWHSRIGGNAHIEFVGAAATLIWEQFVTRGHENDITQTSARLLYAAIISNTLNFHADLTCDRDHSAANALLPLTGLGHDWPAHYYRELEASVMTNISEAIVNDVKIVKFSNLDLTLAISQLELWDARDLLPAHADEISRVLSPMGHPWFHTTPSISEGKNYVFTEDTQVKQLLKIAIHAKFHGNIGESPRLWMRKEILKQLYQLTAENRRN